MLYRYSHIAKYAQCPHQYFRDVILGEEKTSEEMALGTAVHRAVQEIVEKGTPVENAVSQAIKDTLDTEGISVKLEDVLWMTKRALKYLVLDQGEAYDLLDNPPMYNVVHVEKIVNAKLNDSDPFSPVVKGTVDLICRLFDKNEYAIWDWKSGRTISDPMQLKVYSLICRKLGFNIRTAGFAYLRKKEKEWFEVTGPILNEAEEWLKDNVAKMDAAAEELLLGEDPDALYPAKANCYCGTCLHAGKCPLSIEDKTLAAEDGQKYQTGSEHGEAAKGRPVPEKILSYEDAVEIGAEIIRIEGVAELFKDRLKDFVKSCRKPVVVGNKRFDFIPSTSWSFSPDNLKKLTGEIAVEGLNPWAFLDLSAASRTRLFNELNWAEDQTKEFLSRFGESKNSSSFRCVALK